MYLVGSVGLLVCLFVVVVGFVFVWGFSFLLMYGFCVWFWGGVLGVL